MWWVSWQGDPSLDEWWICERETATTTKSKAYRHLLGSSVILVLEAILVHRHSQEPGRDQVQPLERRLKGRSGRRRCSRNPGAVWRKHQSRWCKVPPFFKKIFIFNHFKHAFSHPKTTQNQTKTHSIYVKQQNKSQQHTSDKQAQPAYLYIGQIMWNAIIANTYSACLCHHKNKIDKWKKETEHQAEKAKSSSFYKVNSKIIFRHIISNWVSTSYFPKRREYLWYKSSSPAAWRAWPDLAWGW